MTSAKAKTNVLFVNTGSAVTSILAAALANRLGAEYFNAYAATARPAELTDPVALAVLKHQHFIPTPNLRSKSLRDFTKSGAPLMDCIITLDQRPGRQPKPAWPGFPALLHWPLRDPGTLRAGDPRKGVAFPLACQLLALRIDALVRLVRREDIFSLASDHTPRAKAVEHSYGQLMQATPARAMREPFFSRSEKSALLSFAEKRGYGTPSASPATSNKTAHRPDEINAILSFADNLRRAITQPDRALREISLQQQIASDLATTDRLLCGITPRTTARRKASPATKRRVAARPKSRS